MSTAQIHAIGKNPGYDIYHPEYEQYHPPADDDCIFEDEDEQTFDEFVKMGKRNPNYEGTGRWKKTAKRSQIAIVDCSEYDSVCLAYLRDFIAAYFQLKVDIISVPKSSLCVESKTFCIEGNVHLIETCVLGGKKRKANGKQVKPQEVLVDVFTLFDALTDLATEPYISILALVDVKLGEENDGKYGEVLGRACGDRVACVSTQSNDTRKALLVTIIHELLHTIGFDHCNSYKCVMNAIGGEDWLFLSPPNLRKLKVFHGVVDSDQVFLIERYTSMEKSLAKIKPGTSFKPDLTWLKGKIKRMREITGTTASIEIL